MVQKGFIFRKVDHSQEYIPSECGDKWEGKKTGPNTLFAVSWEKSN